MEYYFAVFTVPGHKPLAVARVQATGLVQAKELGRRKIAARYRVARDSLEFEHVTRAKHPYPK